MSRSHYFFLKLSVPELERIVHDYQEEFNTLLEDTFSDDELQKHEKMIDSIAAVYIQPISEELTFDDFYPDPKTKEEQKSFFERCRSCLCVDNLPYFESNPFQVTYLKDLLWSFEEVLIDRGGVSELTFRKDYLEELKRYKTMESLIDDLPEVVNVPKTSIPVTPIDFLVVDIYKELKRIGKELPDGEVLSEKARKIFEVMRKEELDSEAIFKKSGLNAKDFDDNLEKVKFWLKKL